jgi:hypothetical protein
MTRDLDLLPRCKAGIDLSQELIGFLLEFEYFLFQIDITVRREERQFLDLLFQFGYRFFKFQVF